MDGFLTDGASSVTIHGTGRFDGERYMFRKSAQKYLMTTKSIFDNLLLECPVTITFDGVFRASCSFEEKCFLSYFSRGIQAVDLNRIVADNQIFFGHPERAEAVTSKIISGLNHSAMLSGLLKSNLPIEFTGILKISSVCGLEEITRVIVDPFRKVKFTYPLSKKHGPTGNCEHGNSGRNSL